MIPSFAQIQWLARDREDEIRRKANEDHIHGAQEPQPGLQERLATMLRLLANRLDPEPTIN